MQPLIVMTNRKVSPCDARKLRGFTLIELMVVIAIVAILVGIAVPAYQDAVRKSRRGQAKADLVELAQRAERYHTVNNAYNTGAGFLASLSADELQSPRGPGVMHYQINGVEAANTFTLTAVPQGGQARDTRCMTLTLNQAGTKGISGGTGTVAECW